MKLLLSIIFGYICVILAIVFGWWSIISFILYLVKDTDFQWWAFTIFIVSLILGFVLMFITALLKNIEKKKSANKVVDRYDRKSKFQQRLEKAAKKREHERNS